MCTASKSKTHSFPLSMASQTSLVESWALAQSTTFKLYEKEFLQHRAKTTRSKLNEDEKSWSLKLSKMSFATPPKASNSGPSSPMVGLMKLMAGDGQSLGGNPDQSLTCPLCQRHLKNPRVLPNCLHSFCLICLQLHVGKSRHFFCPVCQQVRHSYRDLDD